MVYKILLFTFYVSFISVNAFSQDISQSENTEIDSLKIYQIEKLKQEIEILRSENSLNPIIRNLPTYAGIITALVAIIGAIISYLKYLKEKHSEIEQKIQENKIRLESKFDSIITNLGSTSPSIQASASVSLLTFLKPEYHEFHHQVYLILLANLKTNLPKNVNTLMVKTFEKAIRLNLKSLQSHKSNNIKNSNSHLDFDLSRANLYRIDLHGLDLENVDLAFSDLRYANLDNCNLKRAKGFKTNLSGARLSRTNITEGRFNEANFEKAQFHESVLVSTKMKNTNLNGAEFQQAHLQDAHLDDSDIHGAKFEHANLNNTFFKNVICTESDLKSILKSKNASWEKANFDKEIKMKLKQLSSK